SNVAACSPLAVRAEKKGTVDYVDSQKIIIKESARVKKTYQLSQLVASNKNTLNFSTPLVKKGDLVEKEQIIANASYIRNGELALGQNLRVAYCCWEGYNFEDAIVISDRLVKEDILTSFFVKKYTIIRYHTKHGEEVFTNLLPHLDPKDPKKEDQERQVHEQITHLDQDGIVKVGSRVKAHDILVGKRTPQPRPQEESEEEALLLSILGEASRKFVDSSLYLPTGEKGEVYEVRRKKLTKNRRELEVVEVYVAQERKIEAGDKQVDRYGYKGVIAKIVPAADLPYDEEGKTFDILINPLGIPSRLNIGKLLETILAEAAYRLNSKFLVRPFNTLSPQIIKQIMQEAGISPNGTRQLFNGRTGLPFAHPVYTGYTYIVKLNHMVADK
ncbi:13453_t:CDS:1, partial [Racocetra persica]